MKSWDLRNFKRPVNVVTGLESFYQVWVVLTLTLPHIFHEFRDQVHIWGAFHKTCHQRQMTVVVISYWNPCFWLVINRFVTEFCHLSLKKKLCEMGPSTLLQTSYIFMYVHYAHEQNSMERGDFLLKPMTVFVTGVLYCCFVLILLLLLCCELQKDMIFIIWCHFFVTTQLNN